MFKVPLLDVRRLDARELSTRLIYINVARYVFYNNNHFQQYMGMR